MKTSQVQQQIGKIINNMYITKKRISAGSFGVVYLGQDLKNKNKVAIKIEKCCPEDEVSIKREVAILEHLQGLTFIPRLYWSGEENNEHILVMDLLGRDLTFYLKRYRKFSVKCVANIADQMLTALEEIHGKLNISFDRRSVVHRDIKPENIIVGRDEDNERLYLVDYGISKFYKDKQDRHLVFQQGRPFVGTSRYASVAAHNGDELSRKDDLESLAYMLIYLLKGV